ncbi:MAG: DUF3703 domain-containing protein [Burkholderiales bacterium]
MSRFARRIRPAVQFELDAAHRAEASGNPDDAFRRLERAHVLGQATTIEHVRVHWHMSRWAARRGNTGDAVNQLWRMTAAAMKTGIGWIPLGNTGGSNVSAFQRMPIPVDLQRLIDAARR